MNEGTNYFSYEKSRGSFESNESYERFVFVRYENKQISYKIIIIETILLLFDRTLTSKIFWVTFFSQFLIFVSMKFKAFSHIIRSDIGKAVCDFIFRNVHRNKSTVTTSNKRSSIHHLIKL